jgi:sugar phosphate isomerase/epimerase
MIFGATNNPLRPLSDEIKVVAASGFDYLELCLDPPNGLPEKLKPIWAEIKSVLAGEGLGLPIVHLPTFVFLADIYPSIREASVTEVFKALDLAAEIGAGKAVLHPGYLTGLLSFAPDMGKEYAAESLNKILNKATGQGITICLENMFPRVGHMYGPEEFKEVLRRNPGLMMTLDLGHANIRSHKNQTTAFVEMARGRIGHVHIGDNNGQEDEHLPVGTGRVNVAGGLEALKESGYDQTITLEVFSPDRDYLAISLKKVKTFWDQNTDSNIGTSEIG